MNFSVGQGIRVTFTLENILGYSPTPFYASIMLLDQSNPARSAHFGWTSAITMSPRSVKDVTIDLSDAVKSDEAGSWNLELRFGSKLTPVEVGGKTIYIVNGPDIIDFPGWYMAWRVITIG